MSNNEQTKDLIEKILRDDIKKYLNQIANDSADASRRLHNLLTDNVPKDYYDPEYVDFRDIEKVSEELLDLALSLRLKVNSYNMLRCGRD